jgi:N-acetylglucosaminylphosphatidylinositol deacetylase
MTIDWNHAAIMEHIALYTQKHNIDVIITFDEYGISGHTNHRAIYNAIATSSVKIPSFALQSASVVQKFSFSMGVLWGISSSKKNHIYFLLDYEGYLKGRAAMYEHTSQLVWFRLIYLLTSGYMIMNELKPF